MLKFLNILLVVSFGVQACCSTGERKTVRLESKVEYMMDYSCLFLSPEVGLIGGDWGYHWKTTDGGRHWQKKKFEGNSVEDL